MLQESITVRLWTPDADIDVLDELYSMVDDERLASEPISLSQAMDEYGAQLPLMFAVGESLYGICESTSLMANQLLSVHAEKETKVINVVTDWGDQYMIPFTAMFECSPLYDPHGKFETAKGGYNFKTAGDLIQADPLPFKWCMWRQQIIQTHNQSHKLRVVKY